MRIINYYVTTVEKWGSREVGLVLPSVEAAVQAQGDTPEQRIAPLAKFSFEVAWRCGGLFLLLAALAAALNLHSPK